MNVSTARQKPSKYNYKTQSNTPSHRSVCQTSTQNQKRKQSRTKMKKGSTQNSQIKTDRAQFDCFLIPLSQIQENSMKMAMKRPQAYQREIANLKTINQELKQSIETKENEISSLRFTLEKVSNETKTYKNENQEIKSLRQANSTLQQKIDSQALQMQNLKKQFSSLRELFGLKGQQVKSSANIDIGDSIVSLREYCTKNYQKNTQFIKDSSCFECKKYKEEIQILKTKYGNELRKLQQQIVRYKEKDVIFEVLQQQVQNKNQCIDYLRQNLQHFQRKSNDLLQIVYALENRMQNNRGKLNRENRKLLTPKWEQFDKSAQIIYDRSY